MLERQQEQVALLDRTESPPSTMKSKDLKTLRVRPR